MNTFCVIAFGSLLMLTATARADGKSCSFGRCVPVLDDSDLQLFPCQQVYLCFCFLAAWNEHWEVNRKIQYLELHQDEREQAFDSRQDFA